VSTEEATGATTSVKTKERNLTVTAIVTAQAAPASMYVSRGLDDIQDLFGKTLLLELVSCELDPSEFLSLSLSG
jgi:lipoxygenase